MHTYRAQNGDFEVFEEKKHGLLRDLGDLAIFGIFPFVWLRRSWWSSFSWPRRSWWSSFLWPRRSWWSSKSFLFFSRTFSRASWKIEEFESACEIREISATLSSARNEPNRKKTPIRNWRNFRHTKREEYYTIIFNIILFILFGSNPNACLRWGFSLHLYFSWYGMPRVAFCTTYTWAMPSEAWQLVWLSLSSTLTYLTRDPSTRKKTKCLHSHFLGF